MIHDLIADFHCSFAGKPLDISGKILYNLIINIMKGIAHEIFH